MVSLTTADTRPSDVLSDVSTEISVATDASSAKKPLSQEKLKQLESARVLAIDARRRKLRDKLELKLTSLRQKIGELPNDTLLKAMEAIVERDERVTERYHKIVDTINNNMKKLDERLAGMEVDIARMHRAKSSSSTSGSFR